MLGVLLMYAGLAVTLLGGVSLLRPLRFLGLGTRRRAAAAVGAGGLLVTAATLLPARLQRAPAQGSLLDTQLPAWQFGERHEIRVHGAGFGDTTTGRGDTRAALRDTTAAD